MSLSINIVPFWMGLWSFQLKYGLKNEDKVMRIPLTQRCDKFLNQISHPLQTKRDEGEEQEWNQTWGDNT